MEELLYNIWRQMSSHMPTREQDDAIEDYLGLLYEEDVDIKELIRYAEFDEDKAFISVAKRYIDDEDEEDEEW